MENVELLAKLNLKLEEIIELLQDEGKKDKENRTPLYNNADIQKLLGISSSTLQKYRSTGMIGFIQKGKKIYYTQKHLDDFISTDFESE